MGAELNRTTRSSGHRDDIDLLGEIWGSWLRAGQRIPAHTWDAPTGLGDWTVRELYAHVARGVTTLAGLVATPTIGEPELPDAAAYFAAVMAWGADGARQVAGTATEFAAAHSITDLTGQFDVVAATTLADARAAAESVVPTIAGSMRLSDYVLTRVLEATVHLLDLCDAVADTDPPPDRAVRRTVDVLADLLPATDFIRLATGRSAPPVFPVLT
jgi:uncharacterized protein (TIGR03083 family)